MLHLSPAFSRLATVVHHLNNSMAQSLRGSPRKICCLGLLPLVLQSLPLPMSVMVHLLLLYPAQTITHCILLLQERLQQPMAKPCSLVMPVQAILTSSQEQMSLIPQAT